ncbi:MAG: membrane protein insertion efficiency factor YidD [Gammaproteobacteria bacterium]|nr:MAG: membrane protein insertion efficiency factor YidD [Gammaproteobacteria bacterium]
MAKIATKIFQAPGLILIFFIKIYRALISPLLGSNCRFIPTCSDYSMQAIEKYGAIKGLFLAIKRIFKCHPFHQGGIDNVP